MDGNERHPDPLAEGMIQSGQRLVQIISLSTLVIRSMISWRAKRRAAVAENDKASEQRADAELKAIFEAGRVKWAPAHDPDWLRGANLIPVAEAWAAAVPYTENHAPAASAVRKCEERLRNIHPHAMEHYDRLRADGRGPFEAMQEAAPFFTRDPNVRTGHRAPTRSELPQNAAGDLAAEDFPHDIRTAMRISTENPPTSSGSPKPRHERHRSQSR